MLDDAADGEWVYRRDPRIRRPLPELSGPASTSTYLVLAPEIQLLYKSEHPRSKDERDFHVVHDHLTPDQCRWLDGALAVTSPAHPWRASLQELRSRVDCPLGPSTSRTRHPPLGDTAHRSP